MGFDDLREYAERTAGLVDQARSSDMDFELMLDLLRQECGIISEMIDSAVSDLKGGAETPAEPEPKPEPKPRA